MGLYYNGKKVRNLYYNGKCITRLALGKEMTRLVEGDDYVTADWLVGDGAAYIDTNIIPLPSDTISLKVNHTKPNSIKGIFGVFYHMPELLKASCFLVNYTNAAFATRYFSQEIYPASDTEVQVVMDKDEIVINGVQSAFSQYSDIPSPLYSLPLFTRLRVNNGELNYIQEAYNCRISYFNIPNKLALTPCRLLRPIPATLDGNGIARNAGECGMFDAVSGKFYGNVANSGNFTVSDN